MASVKISRFDRGSLLLAGVLLGAAVIRIIGLGGNSLWPDEGFSWNVVNQPFLDMYHDTINDSHPPLFNVLAWAWMQVTGDSEFALRLPSALYGVGTVYVTYLIGRLLWDRETGLTAAIILALSGFHIWYSQEFRDYSLLCLTSALYVHALLVVRDTSSRYAYAYATASALLMLFSHAFGVFLFTGVNLYVGSLWLIRRPLGGVDFSSWVISQVCALLVFSYWGWLLFGMSSTKATWIPELSISRFFLQLGLLFNGPLSAVVMCSLALFLIYQRLLRPVFDPGVPRTEAWQDGLVLVWLASPILIAAIVSVTVRPVFVSRYMILCLPAMCLVVARALAELRAQPKIRMMSISLTLAGLLISVGYAHYLEKEPFRIVVTEMASQAEPGDTLIVYDFVYPTVRYYWREPAIDIEFAKERPEVQSLFRDQDRIWVIHWRNLSRKTMFRAGERTDNHQVVQSSKTRKVELYLLTRVNSGE